MEMNGMKMDDYANKLADFRDNEFDNMIDSIAAQNIAVYSKGSGTTRLTRKCLDPRWYIGAWMLPLTFEYEDMNAYIDVDNNMEFEYTYTPGRTVTLRPNDFNNQSFKETFKNIFSTDDELINAFKTGKLVEKNGNCQFTLHIRISKNDAMDYFTAKYDTMQELLSSVMRHMGNQKPRIMAKIDELKALGIETVNADAIDFDHLNHRWYRGTAKGGDLPIEFSFKKEGYDEIVFKVDGREECKFTDVNKNHIAYNTDKAKDTFSDTFKDNIANDDALYRALWRGDMKETECGGIKVYGKRANDGEVYQIGCARDIRFDSISDIFDNVNLFMPIYFYEKDESEWQWA